MGVHAEALDYSIHFFEPHHLLIAHMRYIGNDFKKDMAGIAEDENTKRWWKVSAHRQFACRKAKDRSSTA